jgi:PKD repeat protein
MREASATSPGVIGLVLVLIGMLLFLVVFFTAFPVLSDPVGTYDEWFPDDESATPADEDVEGPLAVWRYEADSDDGIFRVRFEDRSEPGDAPIVEQTWDLGDGTEAQGPAVNHRYREPGVYPVRLKVEDENGETSKVEDDVEVPELGRTFGRAEAEKGLDLSGIESAVEDAVETMEAEVEDSFDSIFVIALFGLAAIATTVVAWRITRSGVMLLRPDGSARRRSRKGLSPAETVAPPAPTADQEKRTELTGSG